MSAPAWFAERSGTAAPIPGWRGLILRQPRLVQGIADRATLAAPVAGGARQASLPEQIVARPRAVRKLGLREEERHRGSLSLAGLGLRDETLPAPRPPTGDDDGEWPHGGGGGTGLVAPDADVDLSLARMLASVLQPPAELLLAGEGPIEWHKPLLPFQLDGIRALLDRPSLLLADDMGLGKTVQSIAAIRILTRRRQIENALVVVPAGLLGQWRSELALWAPELRAVTVHGEARDRAWRWRAPAHVYLTTYETLRSDYSANPHSPLARTWDLVVLDEAQRIKNPDAEISRVCKRLSRVRQWALSGTPLENSIEDLISILDFVDPAPAGAGWQRVSQEELRERLRRVQLRRRKSEVLKDLPPKLVTPVVLPLTASQRASYDRAEREGIVWLRDLGRGVRVGNVLELIARLKAICNFDPVTGHSSKLEDMRERLRTLATEGHKALVFTQFANAQSGARAIANALDGHALVYTGDLSTAERDRVLARFRAEEAQRVLVLSLRAGGQGLNLQDASYVFHFDRWWNPAVEQQAESRSHRLGQRYPVTVYTYTSEGTIEERIEQTLAAKQGLFDQIVDDVTIDLPTRLSGDELFGLFDLRAPRQQAEVASPTLPDPAPAPAPARDYAALSPEGFEAHVGALLERRGWRVAGTPPSRDGGIDLIATRADDLGSEVALYIQCKNHANPVGVRVLRELNGAIRQAPGARGVLACPAGATADATAFARDRGILIWDRAALAELEQPAHA